MDKKLQVSDRCGAKRSAAGRRNPHQNGGCVKTLGGGSEGSIWFVGKAAKVSESAVYVLYMSISELEANAAYGPKTSSDTPPPLKLA